MYCKTDIAVFLVLCLVVPPTLSCYSICINKFSLEMEKARNTITAIGENTTDTNNIFCRAMSNQIDCLQTALSTCPPQQQTFVQSMLSMFIRPDYQRKCVGRGSISTTLTDPTIITPTTSTGLMTKAQIIILCSQKMKGCQTRFNQSFTSHMASYNVSGICQSLKQFTGCLMTLMASQCSQLLSQSTAMITKMQQQYGSMCSSDAQASTLGMLGCVNRTMSCHQDFNTEFSPALAEFNLMLMCQSLDNYTQCAQHVGMTSECTSTITSTLQGIARMRTQHNVYCGNDLGKSTQHCLQLFQDCFRPFNKTFFPAVQSSNLTMVCSSLTAYTSCVGRLTPDCSQQLQDMIQSAQSLRQQYSHKCHPNILELSNCQPLGQCSQAFFRGFPTAASTTSGICGSIGNYFPCVAKGLEECQLPQSTTEVSFRQLGVLMHSYCNGLASQSQLLKCSAFITCTTAVMVSFSPNMKTMFEGSTWCTFMQMSIGCAKHALQSSNCFLSGSVDVQQDIDELDQLRVSTCEAGSNLIGRAGQVGAKSQHQNSTKENGKANHGNILATNTRLVLLLVSLVFVHGSVL